MIYVVHKIRLAGRASRYSAWFKVNPFDRYTSQQLVRDADRCTSLQVVLDAERIDRRGRSYPVTDAEIRQLAFGSWISFRAPVAIPTLEGGAA